METKPEIAINEYYFLINKSGYYLKTKYKGDYEEVLEWGGIVFSRIIKNSNYLHYKVGKSWLKKRFSQLHIAKPTTKTVWHDDGLIETPHHSIITNVEIGGSTKTQTYEEL